MRLGPIPENPIERVIARLNVSPQALFDAQMAYTARVVMVATKLGVFEALAGGTSTASAVAERCGTEPAATEKLLFALAGSDYLRSDDGQYVLSPMARKWLLRNSPTSLADKLLLRLSS